MKRLILLIAAAALVAFALTSCTGPRALNTVTLNPDRGTQILRNIDFGGEAGMTLDVYRPQGPGPHPILVFFYGGSWERGSKGEYAFVGKRFASEGYVTMMADYSLLPEGAWPVFMEDVAAAVAFAHREASTYGGNPDRLFLSGHSAGAYNAVLVASAPEFLATEGGSTDMIAGVAGISGPYDFLPSDNPSVIELLRPAPDQAITQPVNRVSADTPPMLFIHGLEDTVVFRHNAENMKAALDEAGVRAEVIFYPEADHADTLIGIAWPRRSNTVADMVAFFESVD